MDHSEIQQQFLAAMLTRELTLSDGKSLVADGNWHRCNANNKPEKNDHGAYKLCVDGPTPWGLFRNWTDGQGVESWYAKQSRPLTEAERRELERRIEQQRIEHEKEAAALAAEVADKAQNIWDTAKDAPADHPYLKRKKIKSHGLQVSDGRLIVPMMYGHNNKLVNLQFIAEDGSKWYLKGGRAKGAYFRIPGSVERRVVLVEGVATGASIAEAVGCLVVVAFSAGNLESVATAIRRELSNADADIWKAHVGVAEAEGLEHELRKTLVNIELVVAADDDWKTKDNPGLMAALKATRAARARVAVPVFEKRKDGHTDFNDLAVAQGAEAVQKDIAAAVEPDVLMEKWLLADPHAAFGTAWVKELAALKQADPVRYEKLLGALKAKKVRVAQIDRAVKALLVETEEDD